MIRLLVSFLPIAMQAAPAPKVDAPSPTVLHLDAALQTAQKQQPQVIQARASTEAAAGRADESRSGLLPQLTGSASYQRIHGSAGARPTTTTTTGNVATPAGATTVSTSGTYDYFSFGLSASQLIWDFGQTYDKFRAANRSVDAYRATEQTTQAQVALNVRRAFFNARAQKALVRVAEETLANESTHYKQIEGFVRVGTRPEIDLAQERTTIANFKVQLINAQNGYAIGKAQLNQTMGIVGTSDYEVADEGLGPVEGEDEANELLVQKALAARPELVSLKRSEEAQQLTVKSYKGAYGPSLSATAGASETGTSLDNLGPNWNIGASLVWPIFQGGLTKGYVREAEANVSIAHAQLDAEALQVRFDVEQAALTVRAAKESIAAANDALANARDRLRLAEGRYQAGVGSIIELGDAQVALTNAAAQLVQADYNLSTARAQLLTALGRP